ncbi:hypothetical protein HHL17_09670 [Chitinophaga sp. G-6-1-13]|uniref:Uncharacterized protein n=1 Tax=Chitinophaga fulva TaxID=2728842 RepID=A0A848GJ90_9BACT|nr:hypothetical protein [Chitinophaga fulva]NML37459.1 hypothetical protein [Chitinophaga fulva]
MITGYVIARKPMYDFSDVIIGRNSLLRIEDKYYHGIDRLNWIDVESRFKQSAIPENLLNVYTDLEASEQDLTGIKVLKKYDEAVVLMSLDEEMTLKNEILVIASNKLNQIKGHGIATVQTITWLGYDIVLLGGWSLIRHAIFENRQMSLLKVIALNSFGLLDNEEQADDFLKQYNKLADLDSVDPLLDNSSYGVDCIRVGVL